MDLDRVNSSQPVKPPPALAVLRKTPQVFRYSQKYPSTLGDSLQFSPFSLFQTSFFSNLFKLVTTPSLGRNLVVLAPILVFFMCTHSSRSVDWFYATVSLCLICLVTVSYLFLLYAYM
jgi:hypothetical protein